MRRRNAGAEKGDISPYDHGFRITGKNSIWNNGVLIWNCDWQFFKCLYLSHSGKREPFEEKKPLHELWISASLVRPVSGIQLSVFAW